MRAAWAEARAHYASLTLRHDINFPGEHASYSEELLPAKPSPHCPARRDASHCPVRRDASL